MGLRQPRANVSWKKKNRKKIDLFWILDYFISYNILYHTVFIVSDLLLIGMNTHSLFSRFLLKKKNNLSADVSRTILKAMKN